MRDEDEVQSKVDAITDMVNTEDYRGHNREYLCGLADALDWVLDEDEADLL